MESKIETKRKAEGLHQANFPPRKRAYEENLKKENAYLKKEIEKLNYVLQYLKTNFPEHWQAFQAKLDEETAQQPTQEPCSDLFSNVMDSESFPAVELFLHQESAEQETQMSSSPLWDEYLLADLVANPDIVEEICINLPDFEWPRVFKKTGSYKNHHTHKRT